jgi:hypothetical protein
VDGVPIANQSEREQQKCDQQQAGSFRGINRVPAVLVVGVVLVLDVNHDCIVRRTETVRAATSIIRIMRGGGLVLHYASLAVVH